MAKKNEVPKINQVVVQYNGNEKAFDFFMESMIHEFLNSCGIAKAEQNDFIDNVENSKKILNAGLAGRYVVVSVVTQAHQNAPVNFKEADKI